MDWRKTTAWVYKKHLNLGFGATYTRGFMGAGTCEFNSLAPGRFKVNFRWVIFMLILVINGWVISCETALIWLSLDYTYGKSSLVQVMARCCQATSHYLSQCWPRSQSPYGITRPQWVNSSPPGQNGHYFGRRQFQIHFLEWKWYNSDSIFTEICSQESNWQ